MNTVTLAKSAGQFASKAVTSAPRVLPDLSALAEQNAMLMSRLAEMEAALAAKANGRAISLKVSEKGALCVYGLGRFPVTLYAGQWRRLLAEAPAIEAFLKANASHLTEKPIA
jgi:hypothetical protein